jgi:acylphosphatase
MSRCRLEIHYSGRVQGVGFRYTVKTVACGYEVTGIVRNLLDGRVLLQAEGIRAELEAFQQAIRESEVGRFIREETADWQDAKNDFSGFEIVR